MAIQPYVSHFFVNFIYDKPFLETESIGRNHAELSQQLMEQIEKVVREFREEQKNKRKPVENLISDFKLARCSFL